MGNLPGTRNPEPGSASGVRLRTLEAIPLGLGNFRVLGFRVKVFGGFAVFRV